MRKTGQLIFYSKKDDDVMKKIKESLSSSERGSLYLYHMEILCDRACSFIIEEQQIEAAANKTLVIRTPVRAITCVTAGVNVMILYETGDSTSRSDRALEQIIGNGVLSTESQTIIGAINEIYSTPRIPSLGEPIITPGDSFVFPNQETLLKIDEPKFQEWDNYKSAIGEIQDATSYLNSEIQKLKSNPSVNTTAIENRLTLVESRLQATMGAAQQAYDLAQRLNSNVVSLSDDYTRLYVNNGTLSLEMGKQIAIQNVTGESTNLQIQPLRKGKPYNTGFIITPKKNLSLTFPQGYTFYWSGPKITTLETGKFYKYDMTFDGELLCAVSCTVYTP